MTDDRIDTGAIESNISDLLDDVEFQRLNRQMARLNLFEAVGAIRAELRHSNFLAFLLSPSRSHGFGASLLRRVLREILNQSPVDRRPVRALQLVVSDLDDAVVYREWNNIDLLIEIESLKLVVVIENKIDSKAGEDQLARYRRLIENRYSGFRHLFVFLTPGGTDPDEAAYTPFSYSQLANVLDEFCTDPNNSGAADAKLILTHYVEMLRRHIVQDEALQQLARRIYEQHKEALDFIFDSRPQAENLLGAVRSLLDEQGNLVQDRHTTTVLRFAHDSWATVPELNCCPADAWTRTGRNVLFEIQAWAAGTWADRVMIALYDGPGPSEVRERIYNRATSRPGIFKGIVKPMGRQWARIYLRELLTPAAAANMEFEEKKAAIENGWQAFVTDDLPGLASAVIDIARA